MALPGQSENLARIAIRREVPYNPNWPTDAAYF